MQKILWLILICATCQLSVASNYMTRELGSISDWNWAASRCLWMDINIYLSNGFTLPYYQIDNNNGILSQSYKNVKFTSYESEVNGTNAYWNKWQMKGYLQDLSRFLYEANYGDSIVNTNFTDFYSTPGTNIVATGKTYKFHEDLFDVYNINMVTGGFSHVAERAYLIVATNMNADIATGMYNVPETYDSDYNAIYKIVKWSNHAKKGYFTNLQTMPSCQYVLITTNVSEVQIGYYSKIDDEGQYQGRTVYTGLTNKNFTISSITNIIEFSEDSMPYKFESLDATTDDTNFTSTVYFGYYTNYNKNVVLETYQELDAVNDKYVYDPVNLLSFKNIATTFSNACTMTDYCYLPQRSMHNNSALVYSNISFSATVSGEYPSEFSSEIDKLISIATTNISYSSGVSEHNYFSYSSYVYNSYGKDYFRASIRYTKPIVVCIIFNNYITPGLYNELSDSIIVNENYVSYIKYGDEYNNFNNPTFAVSNIYLQSEFDLTPFDFVNHGWTNVTTYVLGDETLDEPLNWKTWIINNPGLYRVEGCSRVGYYSYFKRVDK